MPLFFLENQFTDQNHFLNMRLNLDLSLYIRKLYVERIEDFIVLLSQA